MSQGTTNLSGSFTGSLLGTAATASYADNFTVGGTLTAQTINVQTITSSIEFVTGSTRNGALSTNTHQFTGSVLMSGSLDVASTTSITGVLTLGSTISNGTFAYTLPSATGTLALTSALSGYLPLTGGTLTGALSGTTANFSSSIITNATFAAFNGGSLEVYNVGTTNFFDLKSTGGNFALRTNVGAGAVSALTIASTGAATFSSSVTATQAFLSGTSSITSNDQGVVRFKMVNTGGATASGYALVAGVANESQDGFSIYDYTNSKTRVTLTSTGNVGIGTTSPDSLLHLAATQGTLKIASTSTTGANAPTLSFFHAGNDEFKISGGDGLRFLASGTTERMRITSAGNVGIGTSSPNAKLQVEGSSNPEIRVFQTGESRYLTLGKYYIYTTGEQLELTAAGAFPIIFNTNATERMRITSGGQVLIGVTSAASAFTMQVGTDGGTLAVTSLRLQNSYLGGTTGYYGAEITAVDNGVDGHNIQFKTRANATAGFSTRMTITTTGNIGAPSGTNIYNASDIRLKQNISTTTYGLNAISSLNPVKFNWVDGFEPTEDGKNMLGFIAQEVQTIIPEAVESFGGDVTLNNTTITNPLRVNEKFIIPVLVKAIQELSAENNTLKEILQRNNIQ